MSRATPLKTVFGFLNRAETFPSVLITVVESAGDIYGVYPTGDAVRIIDKATGLPLAKEEIIMRRKFIAAAKPIQAVDFSSLLSYGLSADRILVGTVQELCNALDDAIAHDQHTGEELERLVTAHRSMEAFLDNQNTPHPD